MSRSRVVMQIVSIAACGAFAVSADCPMLFCGYVVHITCP